MIMMKIVESDAFLEIPISTQCLYFHLDARADDDGFVGNPRKIMKIVGASEDDLKLLITKNFVLTFENGVIVVKHWRMYNALLQNGCHESEYIGNKASKNQTGEQKKCTEKDLQEEKDVVISVSKDVIRQTDVRRIMEEWNKLSKFGINQISRLNRTSERYERLTARMKQYGTDDILAAIEKIKQSDYLQGKSRSGWTITFDWFVRPNNFVKVLDGNYDNKGGNINGQSNRTTKTYNDRLVTGGKRDGKQDEPLF